MDDSATPLPSLKCPSILSEVDDQYRRYAHTLVSPELEWSYGPLKLILLDLHIHSLSTIETYFNQLSRDLCTNEGQYQHIVLVTRSITDLLISLSRQHDAHAAPIVNEEDVALQWGHATEERRDSFEKTKNTLLKSFLDIIIPWLSLPFTLCQRKRCTIVSTNWSHGFNFHLRNITYERVVVAHYNLLPTRPFSSLNREAISPSTDLSRVHDSLSSCFALEVDPIATSHRSVVFRNGIDAHFVQIERSKMPSTKHLKSSILQSSPEMAHITSSEVTFQLDISSQVKVISCILYELPIKTCPDLVSLLFASHRDLLPLISEQCLKVSRRVKPLVVSFDNLSANTLHCIVFEDRSTESFQSKSSSPSPYVCFHTLPSPATLLPSVLLSSYPSSSSTGRSSWPRFPDQLKSFQNSSIPFSHPIFLLPWPKTGAIKSSSLSSSPYLQSVYHTEADSSRVGVHQYVSQTCLVLSPVSAGNVGLESLARYIQEMLVTATVQSSEIDTIVCFLTEMIPLHVKADCRGVEYGQGQVGGLSLSAPAVSIQLISSLMDWKVARSERECTIITLCDGVIMPSLFRFYSALHGPDEEISSIEHLVLPRTSSAGDNNTSFSARRLRLNETITYELVTAQLMGSASSSSYDIRLPSSSSLSTETTALVYMITLPRLPSTSRSRLLIRGANFLQDLVDVLGPRIGAVTSSSAVVHFEFTTDMDQVMCRLEAPYLPESCKERSSERILFDVKALTPIAFYFDDLIPGVAYIITLPQINNKLEIQGTFRTPETYPECIDLLFCGKGILNESTALNFILSSLAQQKHFDLLRTIQIIKKCFSSSEESKLFDRSNFISDLQSPFNNIFRVHLMSSESILSRRFSVLAPIFFNLLLKSFSENSATRNLLNEVYFQLMKDFVADSIRLTLLLPEIQQILSNASCIYLTSEEPSCTIPFEALKNLGLSIPQTEELCCEISKCISTYLINPFSLKSSTLSDEVALPSSHYAFPHIERMQSLVRVSIQANTETGSCESSDPRADFPFLSDSCFGRLQRLTEVLWMIIHLPECMLISYNVR